MRLLGEQEKLGARIWARPKRLAFFVNEDFSASDLNSVFRYCFRHLGGRSNAVVPVVDGQIGAGWQRMLQAVDPDILYTFALLSDEAESQLTQILRPTRIIKANSAHHFADGWRIAKEEINGVSLSEINLPFRKTLLSGPSCPIILDDTGRVDESFNFCFRNFGAFNEDDWKTYSLESKGIEMQAIEAITDPESMLKTLLPSYGKLYPSQLSTAGYAREQFTVDLRNEDESYEVVIGDTNYDSLYVWNRSTTIGFNWRRLALWLPSSMITSDSMLSLVAQWINEHRHDRGRAECNILSYSISESELEEFARMMQPKIHMRTNHKFLAKDEACEMYGMALKGCAKKTQRIEFGQSDVVFEVPFPDHFNHSKESNQGWIIELELESPQKGISTEFNNKTWHLPVRHKLDRQFITDYRTFSRISANGHLLVEVSADKRNFAINVPSLRRICQVLLKEPVQVGSGDNVMFKHGEYRRIDTSSDGQFLWTILSLFGSLQHAQNFFDDDGWRAVLFDMVGNDAVLGDEIDSLLEKFVQQAKYATSSLSHSRRKARRKLVRALLDMPSEHRYVHRDQVVKRLLEGSTILSKEDDDEFVSRQIHFYLSRNIFLQGADARCYNCGSASWHRIDELKTNMACQGCSSVYVLPPIDSVSFRLNTLIANGVRKLGLLPVFQSLFRLRLNAREHLLFLPQQDLFDWSPDHEKQVTDLDLIGIIDGKYFIGEVKSSEKGLLQIDVDLLEKIALELHPEFLIVAAPTKAFTPKAQLHCKKLQDKLRDSPVKTDFWPLSWTPTIRPTSVPVATESSDNMNEPT